MQKQSQHLAKERRSKIQLYYDIISAIVEDSQNNDNVSPTRIQFKCNTSYDKLAKYLEEMKKKFLEEDLKKTIILGDFNVAPLEEDVWSHKQLENVVSHTKVETDSLKSILKVCGFKDVIRENFQDIKLYSWWSYRARDWDKSNRGRRLDHLWASNDIAAAFLSCSIEREVRSWQPPSDHVPIIATINLL